MTELKLTHSHSALVLFDNCPKRYYHQRVTKEVKDQGSIHSDYGERVHRALELYMRDATPMPEEMIKFERFANAILANLTPDSKLYVEQEITINKKLKPTGWFDDDAWVRAKLDVLVIHKASALVLDWKTGKRKDDWQQLELCAALVFLLYPEVMTIKTTLMWLIDGVVANNPRTYTRGDDQISLLMKMFARIRRVEASANAGVWPAKPSGLCGYCPAQNICEFKKQPYRRSR